MNRLSQTTGIRLSWSILAIFIFICLAFWPVLYCDFSYWDDPHTVHANDRFRPVTLGTFAYYWTHSVASIYIPLTYSVWALLALIARVPPGADGIALNPLIYHAANLLLHVGAATAGMLLLRKLLKHDLGALLGALVFALHPLQVESVAWVSGMKDVLCGALALTAMWQYAAYLHNRNRRWRYALALASACLAMLAKPSAMVIVLSLGVVEWWLSEDRRLLHTAKQAWLRLLPFALASVPIAVIARLVQIGSETVSPLWARPLVAMDAVSFYLCKLVVPWNQTIDYGRNPTYLIDTGAVWHGWVLSALVGVVACLLAWRGRSIALAAMGFFVFPLLPVLGMVKFDFQRYSTVADHYVYVAMLGPALLAGWLVSRGSRAIVIILLVLILAWSVRTNLQASVWYDDLTLLRHLERMTPDSRVAAINLTTAYLRTMQYDQAIIYQLKSEQLEPDNPVVHANAARLSFSLGQPEQGKAALQSMIRSFAKHFNPDDPHVAPVYLQAADISMRVKRFEDAENYMAQAEKIAGNEVSVQSMRKRLENARRK